MTSVLSLFSKEEYRNGQSRINPLKEKPLLTNRIDGSGKKLN